MKPIIKQLTNEEQTRWLKIMLDIRRLPVGVRFLYTKNDYEQCSFEEPSGPRPYCASVKNASLGESCKLNLSTIACLSGARALGILTPEVDIINSIDLNSGYIHYKKGFYVDPIISRQVAKNMVYCQHKVYGVAIAPLEDYQQDNPDVVIIVSYPANMMRLTQGYAYHFGQLKNIKMVGNQAICQECTSYPFETNQPNVSLLCAGTRKAAKWENDELAMGIPYNQLDRVIDGVIKTSNIMDDNASKNLILERAKEQGIQDQIQVTFSSNYYTGGFGTLDYHKKKQSTATLIATDNLNQQELSD